MITFDFEYYKPDSAEEAVNAYQEISRQGKRAIYYAGGTEIISLARVNQTRFDAAIDIKGIPECNALEVRGEKLILGAAVSLTKISDSGLFPLLGAVIRRAADHTARDKITLGGNLCGKTPYKEAILPLLLVESEVLIAGESGMKSLPLANLFDKQLALGDGEFLVQVIIDKSFTAAPYANTKRTRQEIMGYPLVAVAAMEAGGRIRVAFSGLCAYPFRLPEVEDALNNGAAPVEERVSSAIKHFPAPMLNDLLGSAEYREFVVRNALCETIGKLGGAK